MKPQMRQTVMAVWMGVLSIGVAAALAGRAESGPSPGSAHFDQLTVHRLNVVEPNGNPRVIISNRKEFPGLYWGARSTGITRAIPAASSSSTMTATRSVA